MKLHSLKQNYSVFGIVALALALQALFCPTVFASAPAIYFDAPENSGGVGQELAVGIFIDTDQPVNAYAIEFTYPVKMLELIGLDNSRSIIDVWPREPLVYESGKILFKGGSLHAFTGERGELITVRFKRLQEGAADLTFLNPALYLANGKGTKIIPEIRNLRLTTKSPVVSADASPQPTSSPNVSVDTTPPEIARVALTQDPINSDQKLLSFQAIDRDSGIKNIFYQSRSWVFWNNARSAQNPTALPLNVWAVRVAAYDNAGNRADHIVYDWRAFAKGPLVGCLFMAAVAYFLYKTRRGKRIIIK